MKTRRSWDTLSSGIVQGRSRKVATTKKMDKGMMKEMQCLEPAPTVVQLSSAVLAAFGVRENKETLSQLHKVDPTIAIREVANTR